ncbi:MAG: hypothetical protein FRX49_02174 [Trebouxia sp. A1-2]|nr:MAG: hypothetical protein FRX49_02174 [Trebouxia sp. A1-2]
MPGSTDRKDAKIIEPSSTNKRRTSRAAYPALRFASAAAPRSFVFSCRILHTRNKLVLVKSLASLSRAGKYTDVKKADEMEKLQHEGLIRSKVQPACTLRLAAISLSATIPVLAAASSAFCSFAMRC